MSEDLRKAKSIAGDKELKILGEISSIVQQAAPEKASLEEALRCLGKIVDFRSASVYLISRETGKLDEVCSVGRKVDLIGFVNFDMGNGISAWVAKHRRPIVLNNLRKSKGGTHTKSFLSVPMISGREILGVINLAHDEPDSFTRRDSEIVSTVSSMIALIVERISHQQLLAEKSNQLEQVLQELAIAVKHQAGGEEIHNPSDLLLVLNQRIGNPLAIISGNAQFLLMTMKNSSGSVVKRLQAIDKEVSNISATIDDLRNGVGKGQGALAFNQKSDIYRREGIRLVMDRN